MEFEKDPFLVPLIESLNSGQNQNDITQIIYNFQHQISSSLFSKYSDEIILKIFKDVIWIFLLNNAGSPSSSVRLASYHATGAFLTRITPYYPQLIYNSFIDITKQMTVDVKSSAVIASSFAFISTYVAEPYLSTFLKSTPVFHHFATNDPSFSEHLAIIISKLGHLGTQWMENLLQYFLERISEKQDRYIIRAIAAIVSNDPNLYLKIILDFAKSNFKQYLSFITFVLLNHQKEISSTIDLMPIASSAIDALLDPQSNLADFDSALQILSINSDSFHFTTENTTDSECTLKICNDSGESKQATINIQKVISMPSFYSLNLPFDLLKPNPEKDSILVLTAKFKSIASIESFDISEVFSLFLNYITNEYNEITSAAIQGFSFCINRVLEAIPYSELSGTLKKVLFETKSSWYHSFDVLRIIKNIDIQLFMEKLGFSFFEKLIGCLTEFCFCENDSLVKDSISTLVSFTNESNCKLVIDFIYKRTDYFDSSNLLKALKTLTAINSKFNCCDCLNIFSNNLIESVPLYLTSLNLLSEFFKYFSLFKSDQIETILSLAYSIVFATIELISGRTIKTQLKIKKLMDFKSLVSTDMNTKNVDIITQPGNDYKTFMDPMKCSLEFIFTNAQPEEALATAMISDRLFPYECALLYEEKWDLVSKNERIELFENVSKYLKFIGDERVHATWCTIGLKTENFASQTELVELLKEMAIYFLSNDYSNKDEQISASYIQFIYEFDQFNQPAINETASQQNQINESNNSTNQINDSNNESNHANDSNSSTNQINDESNEMNVSNVDLNALVIDYLNKIDNDMKIRIAKIYPKISQLTKINQEEEQIKSSISQLSTEPKIEPITLSSDIDNDKLNNLLKDSIKYSNPNLLEKVLEISAIRNIPINLINERIPNELIPMISIYMSNHLPETITDDDLINALRKCRSNWRQYSISIIKKSPNKLIENLILAEKVKKSEILCLMALINSIEFDSRLLFKLATKLAFNSKTMPRYRLTLKFLSTVVSIQKTISPSFIIELINSISPNIDKIDPNLLAYVLFLTAQKVGVDQEFVNFCKSILNLCGNRSPGHSRIVQILIGVSSNVRLVGRSFYSDLSEIVIPFLQSILPSRYCSGLRLFEQACLSVDSLNISLFDCVDIIIDKYQPYSRFLATNINGRNALIAYVRKLGSVKFNLYRTYSFKVILNSYSAGFVASAAILPTMINSIPLNNENLKTVFWLIDILFKYNNSFNVAIMCLESRLKRISTKAEKQYVCLTALENWIKAGEEKGTIPSYTLIHQITQWYKLFERNIDSPVKILRTMCIQLIKFVPFGYILPIIAHVYIKNNKNEDINQLIFEISSMITKKCHKEALTQLKRQIANDNRNKQIIQLGFFIDDCDEIENLINILQQES